MSNLKKQFQGFPAGMRFTPVPNLFFSGLLPQISDIVELKVTLYVIQLIYARKGSPRFVTYRELLGSKSLVDSLRDGERPVDDSLRNGLEKAVGRGTLLHLVLDREGTPEDAYFLNTDSDRRVVARIRNGELALSGLKSAGQAPVVAEPAPDIFTLYEENIGMLTPMIAEELRAAEQLYPRAWIVDAIKEAVNQNIRKKSYILAILERRARQGKESGTHQRDSQKTGADKYAGQKYGNIIQH